jgi:large subunit ribosomal protein L19e
MDLTTKKRIAAAILKCGVNRVVFDESAAASIKEAITKSDMRSLINQGIVRAAQKKGVSRVRANKRLVQRRLGRQRGSGSRKGPRTARARPKAVWMIKVRSQRALLQELREKNKISQEQFKELYRKAKGDFFRSRRHILLYIAEGTSVTEASR